MNLGHFIFLIMQKASQPPYPIKANLTMTFLIENLGSKPLLLIKNNHLEHPKFNTKSHKRDQPRFTLRDETLKQKPIQPANILIFLKSGGRNMDTGKLSISSSQSLSISSSRWLWVEFRTYVLFLHFLIFQLWHFDFSLVKAPLVFIHYTFGILSLILHK